VKSIGAARSDDSPLVFDKPYGLHFILPADLTSNKTYELFVNDNSVDVPPEYDVGEEILTLDVHNSSYISDICVENGGVDECTLDTLDISFKRPEYRALIYAEKAGHIDSPFSSPAYAKIKLKSLRGETEFFVTVSQLGQISVDI
jgi:hypothetical protein